MAQQATQTALEAPPQPKLAGKTVAFVGDGNNVAKSLAVGCGRLGAASA